MLRPSGLIILPFKIKKASLALRIETLLEKIFFDGDKLHVIRSVVRRGKGMFICTLLNILFVCYVKIC